MQTITPVVYWRPGCPFCTRLMGKLDETDLAYDKINIWDDPAGAEFVRSVAKGNETVPTVVIGGVAHINPTPDFVINASR